MSKRFYQDLLPLRRFDDALDPRFFADVPGDWLLLLTDVKGSTRAIEGGRYKEVNTAGALAAMALANRLGGLDFPFFFGGDGMTCLVPGEHLEVAREALRGTVRKVKEAFGLDLRAAIVPVAPLVQSGHSLRLARWEVSPAYTQAVLVGDGLEWAETEVKRETSPWLLPPPDDRVPEPDLEGYTCRWQDYPAPLGETVALIVRFLEDPSGGGPARLLSELLTRVGPDDQSRPLREAHGRLAWSYRDLGVEAAVGVSRPRGLRHRIQVGWIRAQAALLYLSRRFRLPMRYGPFLLADTARNNVVSSDHRKIDSTLKMVVTLEPGARASLQEWLEARRQEGRLQYGLHVSNRATLTCLMHLGSGQEVHFVDAADGGYAWASRQLKEQVGAGR